MSTYILDAVNTLSLILAELDVTYAILGGAACQLLGSQRITNDIDIVIGLTDTMRSGEDLVKTLCKRSDIVTLNNFGVDTPALRVDGTVIGIEIFDPELWKAQCPHWLRVGEDRVEHTLPSGTTTYIFPPAWLLREKVSNIHRRPDGSPKFYSDATDILFLTTLIKPDEAGVGFLDFTNITSKNQREIVPHINEFFSLKDISPLQLAVKAVCKTD